MTNDDKSPLSAALQLCQDAEAKKTPQMILLYVAAAVDMIEPKSSTPAGDEVDVSKEMAKAMKSLMNVGSGVSGITIERTSPDGTTQSVTVDETNRAAFNANCDAVISGKKKVKMPAGDLAKAMVGAVAGVAESGQAEPDTHQLQFECTAGSLEVARRDGKWAYRWVLKLGDLRETSDWIGAESDSRAAIEAGCQSLRRSLRGRQDLDSTGASRKRQIESHLRETEKRIKQKTAA